MESNSTNEAESTLVKVADVIPERFKGIFNFEYFNEMQSIVAEQILQTDVSHRHFESYVLGFDNITS